MVAGAEKSLEHYVDRIGGIEGENDLLGRRRVKIMGQLFAALVDLLTGRQRHGVRAASGVAAIAPHTAVDRLVNTVGLGKAGGGVVQIYRVHVCVISFLDIIVHPTCPANTV